MKRWAVLVAILYALILGVLGLPGVLVAFAPKVSISTAATTAIEWQWWLFPAVMGVAQLSLLAVPVSVANRRPLARRPLALTVLTAALMMGGLAGGAFCSIYEFALRDKGGTWTLWTAAILAIAAWFGWALVFFRMSKRVDAGELTPHLCDWLLKGSILELLIAVPTHIVARCRDYCCAGYLTFIGLTLGMSVMLFSFGPGVFFLFVARWRRLHPGNDD